MPPSTGGCSTRGRGAGWLGSSAWLDAPGGAITARCAWQDGARPWSRRPDRPGCGGRPRAERLKPARPRGQAAARVSSTWAPRVMKPAAEQIAAVLPGAGIAAGQIRLALLDERLQDVPGDRPERLAGPAWIVQQRQQQAQRCKRLQRCRWQREVRLPARQLGLAAAAQPRSSWPEKRGACGGLPVGQPGPAGSAAAPGACRLANWRRASAVRCPRRWEQAHRQSAYSVVTSSSSSSVAYSTTSQLLSAAARSGMRPGGALAGDLADAAAAAPSSGCPAPGPGGGGGGLSNAGRWHRGGPWPPGSHRGSWRSSAMHG
jgi:hypothetical protein